MDSPTRISQKAAPAPVHPDCTSLLAGFTPTQPMHMTLPPNTITELQWALASDDPDCLTHLVSSL